MAEERIVVNDPRVHAEGVFFGLPEEEYHAALALSASGVKQLRVSPLAWWMGSPLNPNRDETDTETEAKKIGKAYHSRIVEGAEVFRARYAPELDPADFPDALRTIADLTEALQRFDVKVKSGTRKPEMIKWLLACDPTAQIWDLIERSHAEANLGKVMLNAPLIDRIESAAAMIECHPQLHKAFQDGMPEVSIFWRDGASGVPCKARLDYLKPRAIIDLKTFELRDIEPNRAIARAVATYKYHVQACFYRWAADAIPGLLDDKKVSGQCDPKFVRELHDAHEKTFMFVWQAKGIAPVVYGKVLGRGIVMDLGDHAIGDALLKWKYAWAKFGTEPWLEYTEIETFQDSDFPSWIAD